MPRTFRREGGQITAEKIFDFTQYLNRFHAIRFLREARVRYCPEKALQEIDIIGQILDIKDSFGDLILRFGPVTRNSINPSDELRIEDINQKFINVTELIKEIFDEEISPIGNV